jgi:hypothetical protein
MNVPSLMLDSNLEVPLNLKRDILKREEEIEEVKHRAKLTRVI